VRDTARIAHIGIAVRDIGEALRQNGRDLTERARIVSLPFGDSEVELLEPADPASPIARFLERRGPGIHHVCYRVPDLDAAVTACRAAGYRLVDEVPRAGAGGRRIAFVHPKATAGILLELTE
jgi:methylmalonyl-CoA/ethylmalonyl-CoA epimerase